MISKACGNPDVMPLREYGAKQRSLVKLWLYIPLFQLIKGF